MFPTPQALKVTRLGPCRVSSPLEGRRGHFASETAQVLLGSTVAELTPYLGAGERPPAFEAAGPRRSLFFSPQGLRCGVVTCGGLCPGLNDVIRSLVMTLTYSYGVEQIDGFRYGYAGLVGTLPPLELTPEGVADAHKQGGTLLGSSRGPQDVGAMVDTLVARRVSILFAVGGDGTLRGASALSREVARRGLPISVIGIPKTIDNDLEWIERSFGFATAVEEATRAVAAAHTEARGAYNGVGLVKLMGRHSGFITAHAALANSDVNFCLVPEVPFGLDGEDGFLAALEARLRSRHHAVVAVAEGAAQELLACDDHGCDPSGNVRLGDVGPFLRAEIERFLRERGLHAAVRYIDPSYMIRSSPANALDAEYRLALGQYAVHAGMAGRTDMIVGYWNGRFTHVPLPVVTERRRRLEPSGDLWQHVLGATGQPSWRLGAPATDA